MSHQDLFNNVLGYVYSPDITFHAASAAHTSHLADTICGLQFRGQDFDINGKTYCLPRTSLGIAYMIYSMEVGKITNSESVA